MIIEYELDKKDLLHFSMFWKKTSSTMRRFSRWELLGAVLVGSLVFLVFFLISSKGNWSAALKFVLPAALVILLVFLLLRFFNSLIARFLLRRIISEGANRGVLGKHTLALESTGVRETTEYGESFWKWSVIERLDQDGHYIYIFVQSVMAHVVPKRAFGSSTDSEKFFAEARRLWENAKSNELA